MTFRMHFKSVAVYCFSLLIAFLAGMSFGGMLALLFWLLFFYPLLALVHIVYGYYTLKFYEDFSHEHPAKGDTVKYRLSLTNESPLLPLCFGIQFKMIYPGMTEKWKDLTVTLKRNENFSREYDIRCPYRGIYTVGLDSLKLQDALGWLEIFPEVWFRTFYVYPRIIPLDTLPSDIERSLKAAGSYSGYSDDHTLFQTLTDYRTGESIRHMAWKKYFTSGLPFIKMYEKSALPGLDILIDLRRPADPDRAVLEKEDSSIEILVAVVKYLSDYNVKTTIFGFGAERYYYSLTSRELFQEFYKSTITIQFAGNKSPLDFLHSEKTTKPFQSVLFITHHFDSESYELLSTPSMSGISLFSIFNFTGLPQNEKTRITHSLHAAREKGGRIFGVNDSETIKGDLEKS
ncbi:MAG: DUF58 domain-containing protein [Spirochaetales bacterium]|nr:DUF58 domain-containing protein [Spirochaetales bacterium]